MSAIPDLLSEEDQLLQVFMAADEVGVKLEIVAGQSSWEFFPGLPHQKESFRIQTSIKERPGSSGGCACFHAADVYVKFPDGSVKRPDLAIWCAEPKSVGGLIYDVPKVAIEILSTGSRHKDLVAGPPFYLSQGVLDVVVLDPETGDVFWFTPKGEKRLKSPVSLTFSCGCEATV